MTAYGARIFAMERIKAIIEKLNQEKL